MRLSLVRNVPRHCIQGSWRKWTSLSRKSFVPVKRRTALAWGVRASWRVRTRLLIYYQCHKVLGYGGNGIWDGGAYLQSLPMLWCVPFAIGTSTAGTSEVANHILSISLAYRYRVPCHLRQCRVQCLWVTPPLRFARGVFAEDDGTGFAIHTQ